MTSEDNGLVDLFDENKQDLYITLKADNRYEINIVEPHQIRNKKNKYTVKVCKKENGYRYVHLGTSKDNKNHYVHRLVANQFLSNPDNLSEVNHKNSSRSDNRLQNLEFVSRQENCDKRTNFGSYRHKYFEKLKGDITPITL
ncbi:hypothetical protein FACS189472_11120 [Alphaproteobacteria bacterium]|nr:hypothetical protein FACS189472_11120 [Alphaproteobacteria bacterium]